jgi:hypothetical protein
LTSGRKIFVGGGLTGLAAIIAAWVAIGVGGGGGQSGLSTCPLPAYPSASCTGVPAGTTLTPVTGNYDGNTTNEVIDGLDVSGCFVIHAAGVTIKNSKANCIKVGDSGDASRSGTPLEIEDSEVDCDDGSQGNFTGIFPENFKVYRTNIHNCENGASVGDYAEFHDSYIHDLFQCPIAGCPEPGSPHTDGIEFEVGAGSVIAHNTIYAFNPPCSPGNNGTVARELPHHQQPLHDRAVLDGRRVRSDDGVRGRRDRLGQRLRPGWRPGGDRVSHGRT